MEKFDLTEVPEEHMPTPSQKDLWWQYLMPGHIADPYGWWLGWCPLHDGTGRKNRPPSAQFNFLNGSLRCLGDPELECHDMRVKGKKRKTATSLVNVQLKMASQSAGGA